jgi:hypothetical protein
MQAIETKYLGPTNTKGSRIIATCTAGKITVDWNNSLNSGDNHKEAIRALLRKLGWDTDNFPTMYMGTLANGNCVAVFATDFQV